MSTLAPDTGSRQRRPLAVRTRLLTLLRAFIGRIPPAIGNPIAARVGDLIYHVAHKSRRYAIANMRHVLGPRTPRRELARTVQAIFRNAMRNYYDLCRAPDTPPEKLDAEVDFDWEGWQHVVDLHGQKRGIVIVTAHFGGFDLMTQVMMHRGLPLTAMIARISPPWVSDFVTMLRGASGLDFLEVEEEMGQNNKLNFGALKQAVQLLRKGGILVVLADRNLEKHGVPLRFFGDETTVAAGAAKLAVRTHSAIVTAVCFRSPRNRYAIVFDDIYEPPQTGDNDADVRAVLKYIFGRLEYYIARHPDHWVLLQPVWPTKTGVPARKRAE